MKKIISCILFMLCITGIVALNAAAAGVSATVNGIPVPAGGGSVTGAGITGSVSFDATTKTLTLENATITVADGKTAINITSGVDTILLKGTNEIKWADESAQSGNLYAVTASALVIKGQSRADSLKITLPGTTATKAYAINLSAASEIKDCSMDITVPGVTGSGGDCVAVRVAGGDLAVNNASLDLTVGKDGQGNVQATPQGACIYTSHGLTVANSYIDAGLYSTVGGDYFAAIQGATGISFTDSVIYAEASAGSTAKALKIDFATALNIKNCVLVAKGDMWSLCVGGIMGADITAEDSTVEFDGKVLNGKIKSLSGHSAVICTGKDGNVTTYKPGDTIDYIGGYKKILISKTHSHCVCGGNTNAPGHTSHSDEAWTMWTSRDSLPTEPGNYCLAGDVTIDGEFKINNNVKLCLNGKTIRAGSSIPENRYMLTVDGSHELIITDCTGSGTIEGADTRGISVTQDATLTMYGGTIRDFLCGVGVSGTFRMTGNAHITACRESGISLNGAYGRGTRVYLSGNAAITDCVSSTSGDGAGIHINSGSTLFLSGNIRFSGNRYQNPDTGETWGDDILIDYGAIWSFVSNPRKYEYPPVRINGTLDKDLQISFNVGWNLQEAMATRIKTNPVRLIGGENYTLTADDALHFTTTRNASEGYIFAYDEETSGIVMRLDHYHCVCGGNASVGDHTSHTDMGWAMWTETDNLPCNYNNVIYSSIKDGYWYLTDDVTLDKEYTGYFSDCVRLCLHGKTITLTENACIKITKGELIITDCTGQGRIVFPKDGIAVESDKYRYGKLTLFGGTIRGSANGDSDRTGIRVTSAAEFLMYGGVIEKFGHGVRSEGTFIMYGGTIRDCHVIGNGGGVLVDTGGVFIMKDGSIENCSAWNGGGICADGGTLTLTGGTVSGCSAITAGGGIATFDFTAFELGGTVISDCEAWQGGGVRSLSSSAQAVMTGGKITGCRSTDPRSHALYLGDNVDFRALGGRVEGTVCTADGTKIIGSATGTIFTDAVYHAFNAGTFSDLRFEGKGRIVYEYRVFYYSASGILLYINNENASDVYGDGTVSYDDATKTLTLNGATLTGQQMLGATDLPGTLTVVLIGNNVFENDKNVISHTGGDLLIKGTGALRAGWIENKNDIIIESGDIVLDSRGTASGALGTFDNRLVVKGGTLTLIGDPSALYQNGTHTVIADLIPGMWMLAGNAADGSDAVEISDETYKDKAYLRFEARTYRVICAPGADGTGSSSTIVKGYDTAVTLPGALFTRTGYTQTGWATTDGGAKVYELGGTYSANEAVTLYPVWTANRYTISFDTDGGSAVAPITQDYGTTVTAPVNPTKVGYTFAGWDKDIPTTMPAENVTLKAKWTVNKYTITFDTDGGSEIAPITQDYGTTVTAPANPTKVGYTFAGWDKDIPATMPAENVTLKAKWTVNKYTISFDTDGGSEIAPITQDYGTTVTAPANPTKVGYTFAGWDKEVPATMPAENITLKAKWNACDHSGNKNALTCANDVTCSVCGATLAAIAHTPEKDDLDCSTPVLCKVCGQVVTPGMRHSFGDRWYSDETTHWHFCSNGLCYVKSAISSHDWVDVPALAPTKTEDGYTAHRECTVCGAKCGYEVIPAHEIIRGDFDDNGVVDKKDAIYLLRHTIMGELYPLNQSGDMNGDGIVDKNDAVYLLRHTLLPKLYPLK